MVLLASTENVSALTLGQADDFEDGTEQNWIWGRTGFGGPINVAGGFDGNYLQTESFGGDEDVPGVRMAIINRSQWTGDYNASGINMISLDAINEGPNFAFEDMAIRLAFSSNSASIGSGRVVTTQSFPVLRDAGWQHLEFDLTQLTAIAGSNVSEVMSSVTEARIISNSQISFIGEREIARLGIDNVTATVPEPSAALLLLAGLAMFGLGRRGRRR